jgi:serine/threonine-protein kinase RsbW
MTRGWLRISVVRNQGGGGVSRTSKAKPVLLVREMFTIDHLSRVRHLVRWAARLVGLSGARTDRLVEAVNEAAINAVAHGGGSGRLELVQHNQTSLTARVIDDGPGIPPLPVIQRPPPDATSGRGRWLMQQCCDKMRIRTGPRGTTVELDVALSAL